MKKIFISLSLILITINFTIAQDTFSICAIDPVTGQVGSAGASCVAGSIILSDVHPGVGVVHTQAYYISQNQIYARNLMNMGLSPQQIRDSVVAHDYQNNPTIRQYGIVDRVGGGRTAAYTGVNCTDYKNHILGPTYSIQGNILLGQQILDSMQWRFLNTPGTLADKLMAALQGAKVIGADTRCTNRGTSTISAFLRIGRTTDPVGNLYLDLNVNNTLANHDPIDSLQILYNNWLATGVNQISTGVPSGYQLYQNYPNPFNPNTTIKFDIPFNSNSHYAFTSVKIFIYDITGSLVETLIDEQMNPGTYEVTWNAENYSSGTYFYRLAITDYLNGSHYFNETKRMELVK